MFVWGKYYCISLLFDLVQQKAQYMNEKYCTWSELKRTEARIFRTHETKVLISKKRACLRSTKSTETNIIA